MAPGRRGAYAKGIARRQEILDRAIEVFATRGTGRTSLRAIAAEVGVTHAALTHYFGPLDEQLVAVYLEGDAGTTESSPLGDSATPAEIMLDVARSNREVPGLVQLYTSLMAAAIEEGRPAATDFATTWFETARADLSERVRENQRTGRIRADIDPVAVAALVIAASDGLQTQWLLDSSAPQSEALELLDRLLAPPV